MVSVIGTRGKAVDVQLLGVGEVVRRLKLTSQEIESNVDLGVIKAASFVEEEVRESISGNRAEPQSVDTGLLVNSVEVVKIRKAEAKVEPKRKTYPNGQNTQNVALFLEFGTSHIQPRSHFRNTKARNQKKVREIIQKEVNTAVRFEVIG